MAPSPARLRLSAKERQFEARVLDGMPPHEAAAASGVPVRRALAINDRLAQKELGALLRRKWADRVAEQHAALYGFYVALREEVAGELAYARRKRDAADVDDPALDRTAAMWTREMQSLRAELARVEERLRALGAMEPANRAAEAPALDEPPAVLPEDEE